MHSSSCIVFMEIIIRFNKFGLLHNDNRYLNFDLLEFELGSERLGTCWTFKSTIALWVFLINRYEK